MTKRYHCIYTLGKVSGSWSLLDRTTYINLLYSGKTAFSPKSPVRIISAPLSRLNAASSNSSFVLCCGERIPWNTSNATVQVSYCVKPWRFLDFYATNIPFNLLLTDRSEVLFKLLGFLRSVLSIVRAL